MPDREVTPRITAASGRLPAQARRYAGAIVKRAASPVLGCITGAKTARAVAVTFDDGPDPTVTPGLLRLLSEFGVRATFFVLLDQCRLYPELLAATVADGHEIALHGVDHRRLTSFPYAAAVDYLTAARDELAASTGQPIRFYRHPFGVQSVTSLLAVRRAGMDAVRWSSYGPDWIDRDVETVVADSMTRLSAGGILLLHERLAAEPGQIPPTTTFDRIEMTRLLLGQVAEKGWQQSTVGHMVMTAGARRTVRLGE